MRKLTEEERTEYDMMITGAKQLSLFGGEEELDAKGYVIDRYDDETDCC